MHMLSVFSYLINPVLEICKDLMYIIHISTPELICLDLDNQ